ncbi:hypothetical protein ACFVQ0_06240 [Streptomyces sp. NPDC057900]|uniref:hypothetical protein n=1 Tax=Streptomyces sp. NPDC057900 TaxID=3346274 RepID=UPI0036E38A79
MTSPSHHHTPVPDPRALLTALGERVLEREGIPMYLALQVPSSGDDAPLDPGPPEAGDEELAGLFRHYRQSLAPEAADDAEPALIEVLQVLASAHFTPEPPAARKDEAQR